MVSPSLTTLGVAIAALFGVIWAVDYLLERDGREAARKTSRRVFGVGTGIIGALVMLAADLLHLLADVPGIIIGAVGLGGIAGWVDITPVEFVVVMAATYVVTAAVLMED